MSQVAGQESAFTDAARGLPLEHGLASLMGAQGEGVAYVDRHETFFFANSYAERIFGVSPGTLVGRNLREFVPPEQIGLVLRQTGLRAMGECSVYDLEILGPGGEPRQLRVSASPHVSEDGDFRGTFAVFRDITEWRRVEASLGRLSIAIEQASDSIVLVDTRGTILYANPATGELTGIGSERMVGRHIRHLRSPRHDAYFYLNLWKQVLSGEVWRGRIQNLRADGSVCEVISTLSPVRGGDGRILYVVIDSRDVTREVELESQLRHSQRMEAIGVLAGGIAHDFNNILTPILGYAEMALMRASPDEKLHAYLQEILAAGQRAAGLVDQILAFSRQGEQAAKPVLLGPIVKESLKLLRAGIPKTIDIRTRLRAVDRAVRADPGHLHQVVMNLCTNAFQAMRERGGVLEVRLETLDLAEPSSFEGVTLAPGSYLRLIVSDNGCGMDQDTVKKAFLPFYTTRKASGGTGLGLSIVHGIVLAMGGAIGVESEVGRGTSFSVYLPEVGEAAVESPILPLRPVRGRGRILVVDDEPSVGHLMKEILGALGYHPSILDSSHLALETLGLSGAAFDLVISDMTMPGMTGLELLARMRLTGVNTPVILMTGFSHDLEGIRDMENGPLAVIHKPVDIRVLAELLQGVLPQGE